MEVDVAEISQLQLPGSLLEEPETQINIHDPEAFIHCVTTALCEDFYSVAKNCEECDLFDQSLQMCENGVQALKKAAAAQGGRREARVTAQLRLLHSELHAYRLISIAGRVRKEVEESKNLSILADAASKDPECAQLLTLVRWCEEIAATEEAGFAELVSHFTELDAVDSAKAGTIHVLKNGRPPLGSQNGTRGTLSLDLDGASVDEDSQTIDRLLRVSFSLIRCGRVHEARELLSRTGQRAVAALLSMRFHSREPSLTPLAEDHPRFPILQKRALFKNAVEKILSKSSPEGGGSWSGGEGSGSPLRVLLACLAGRLEPLLSLSTRTDDRLWVLANAAVEARLDSLSPDAPLQPPPVPTTINSIFDEVLPHDDWPYWRICLNLLLEDAAGCISFCSAFQTENADSLSDHLLRFMAHLAVIYRLQRTPHDDKAGSRLILAYTGRLFKLSLGHLIPFYASFLNDLTANNVLVAAMNGEKQKDKRERFLEAARAEGHNCASLAHQVVVKARQDKVAPGVLLERFEWLLYLKHEAVQIAIVEANILLRQFLESEDEESATSLLALCAEREGDLADRAELSIHSSEGREGDTPLRSPLLLRAIQEHRATLRYFAGVKAYSAWKAAYGEALRDEVGTGGEEERGGSRRRTTSIIQATERAIHSRRASELSGRRKANLVVLKQKAVEHLERFVESGGWRQGNWQIDKTEEEVVCLEEERRRCLAALRDRLCSRAIFFILHMHEESREPTKALEVAFLFPSLRLDHDISKQNLRTLLSRIQKIGSECLH